MKSMAEMTTAELAAYIQSHLRNNGIDVVLTGGGVVTKYSQQKYVSKDLDFVVTGYAKISRIRETMEEIGFKRVGRHYESSETDLLVEFPGGPFSVG
jgi:ABC-type transport system substrate-binding protein